MKCTQHFMDRAYMKTTIARPETSQKLAPAQMFQAVEWRINGAQY